MKNTGQLRYLWYTDALQWYTDALQWSIDALMWSTDALQWSTDAVQWSIDVSLFIQCQMKKERRKTRTPMPLVIDFICCFSHCLYLLYNVLGLLLNFGSHVFAILYYYCITKSYFVHIKHKTYFWIPFKNICFPASIHFSCL